MLEDNETEATQDDETLFSEVQLSGEVDGSSASGTTLDRDSRFNRLRRATTVDRRASSIFPIRANSIISIEKVKFFELVSLDRFLFFRTKKFPGIADKRDRLELIDYDELTIDDYIDVDPKAWKRTQSMVTKAKKDSFFFLLKCIIPGQYKIEINPSRSNDLCAY